MLDLSQSEKEKHLCYICGCFPRDPRQCLSTITTLSSSSEVCEALFCLECIEDYLYKRPHCPKCRTLILTDKAAIRKPNVAMYTKHMTQIPIRCENRPSCSESKVLVNLNQHQAQECSFRSHPCKICC